MATKKKPVKKETMSLSIELPIVPNYSHFIRIEGNKVNFCCQGNSKWIAISPVEDLANDFNFCPYCGAKLNGLDLHKSISKMIKPNERFSG